MIASTIWRISLLAVVAAVATGCATVAPPPEAQTALQDEASAPGPVETAAPDPVVVVPSAPAAEPVSPPLAAPWVQPAEATPARDDQPLDDREHFEDPAVRGDLWARVREGYALPDLDNELVRKWEQYYAQRPDYVQRMAARGARYLFHIVEEIERRGMPTDLALLPFIESAFDPQALSVARAAGMWQFMPGTGRDFELRQNLFRDDRRDILASTRAALDYLQKLHGLFNDWHLALAAYNWGQGNVQRALARNARARRGGDYGSLRMPDETRNYVPKLQAIKNIVLRPEAYSLVLPPLENHPYFVTVTIERDIDVALVAGLAGLTLEQFQQLNPQLNKPVILAALTPRVLLPYDNAHRYLSGLAAHTGPLASWTAWVAPKTLKPAEAARQVGMAEDQLRQVNRIPPSMLVKVGSTLLVPRGVQHIDDVDERVADGAMIALAPEARPQRRIRIRVGSKGDTVTSLARRHGMTPSALAAANGVTVTARFKAGQLVTVLVPKQQATRTRAAAPTRASTPSPRRAARPAASTRPTR
jgi:membrane-bound lytic murein transglycosylase D